MRHALLLSLMTVALLSSPTAANAGCATVMCNGYCGSTAECGCGQSLEVCCGCARNQGAASPSGGGGASQPPSFGAQLVQKVNAKLQAELQKMMQDKLQELFFGDPEAEKKAMEERKQSFEKEEEARKARQQAEKAEADKHHAELQGELLGDHAATAPPPAPKKAAKLAAPEGMKRLDCKDTARAVDRMERMGLDQLRSALAEGKKAVKHDDPTADAELAKTFQTCADLRRRINYMKESLNRSCHLTLKASKAYFCEAAGAP